MKSCWLTFMLAPIAYAQKSSRCADLTGFRIPGVPMVITKAAPIPASSAARPSTAETCHRAPGPDSPAQRTRGMRQESERVLPWRQLYEIW